MKLKYRLLIPALIVVALIMTLFGSLLIRAAFSAQLEGSVRKLTERARLVSLNTQSAYTNYALQGIEVSDTRLIRLARAQGEDIALERASGAIQERVRLNGRTLVSESALKLSGAWYKLTTALDISEIYAERARLVRFYYIGYLAAICAIALVMLYIVSRVTQPLDALSHASRALAEGNLSTRAQINDAGEIGALAQSFNAMADALSGELNRQTRFIDNLTHEMKTPLTAIIGHADTIRTGKLNEEHTLLAAHTIFHEAKRLDALAGALTEWILLKHDAPALSPLSVKMLLDEVAAAFSFAPDDKRVCVSEDIFDAIIRADRALMAALITNLVRNALNAGAANVIMRCERVSGEAPRAEADAYGVRITVSDDGCGMDEEALKHIMEPFYRVDKARSRLSGGAGLGLALCGEIAKRHGASLRFESAPDKGTRAIIEIAGYENTEKEADSDD